jgi:hypothetical protein
VDRLHGIRYNTREHPKVASDRMKPHYNRLANSQRSEERDKVWLNRPTQTTGKSPKLQLSQEGPYKVITRIKDVDYLFP